MTYPVFEIFFGYRWKPQGYGTAHPTLGFEMYALRIPPKNAPHWQAQELQGLWIPPFHWVQCRSSIERASFRRCLQNGHVAAVCHSSPFWKQKHWPRRVGQTNCSQALQVLHPNASILIWKVLNQVRIIYNL